MTQDSPDPEPLDSPDPQPLEPSIRLRLDIAYDGSAFAGWSTQPDLRTVQGELEDALAVVFNSHLPVESLVVAGRTDAGVHALGQVAHLDVTPAQLASLARPRGPVGAAQQDPVSYLARRLNGLAGRESDIVVSRVSLAAPGFDARFSATWRRYAYRISDAAGPRNPLERHRTTWHPRRLSLDLMQQASASLLGLHDWSAFCKPRDFGTTIRELQEFYWTREPDDVLVAHLRADAFCHSMVRALVGAVVAVGSGKVAPDALPAIRDRRTRATDLKVMPARGLALLEVGYPDDAELIVRALRTKRKRSAECEFDSTGALVLRPLV